MLCLLCNTAQAADNNKVLSEENKILVWKNFKNRHFFVISDEKRHWSMRRLSHHYFEDDRIYILCGYRNLNHVNHECPFYIFSWHSATNYKVCPFHSGTVRKASRVGKLSTKLCESFGLDRQCLRFQHSSLSSGTMYRIGFVFWDWNSIKFR